jgi:hypothetical protein
VRSLFSVCKLLIRRRPLQVSQISGPIASGPAEILGPAHQSQSDPCGWIAQTKCWSPPSAECQGLGLPEKSPSVPRLLGTMTSQP